MSQHFDEEVYDDEVEYEGDYEVDDDGLIEEADLHDSDGEVEEIEADADDEDDQAGDADPQGQMLYLPGLGYVPLSALGNIQGLKIGGRGPAAAAPTLEGERDWKGLLEMPAVTQDTISDLTNALKEDGKTELTILLLGKGGVGKSSTVNSLLNERAANTLAFQQDNTKTTMFSRKSPTDGFVLHVIDTPSLLDQDAVSDGRLEAIGRAIRDKEIDVVLFLDRLDVYSMDVVDTALIAGITRVLGSQIWANTILCLTRASEAAPPAGVDFDEHVAERERQLKGAIDAAGGNSVDVGIALVENSSRCPVNADGEKVVAGDVPWLAELFEKALEVALNVAPFEYDPAAAAKAADPGRRRKWLIPLVLALQVGAKILLDRVMDEDGCLGDANGPFDAKTVEERREELKREKERQKRRKQKAREGKSMGGMPSSVVGGSGGVSGLDIEGGFDFMEEEEEDEWDE